VEIYECVRRPKSFLELLPRDNFARTFQQHHQSLKRLFLQLDLETPSSEFARLRIYLEDPKTDWRGHRLDIVHIEVSQTKYTIGFCAGSKTTLPEIWFRNLLILSGISRDKFIIRKESVGHLPPRPQGFTLRARLTGGLP